MNKILIKQQGMFIYVTRNNETIGQFIINDGINSIAISLFNLLKELEKDLLEDLNVELILE